MGNCCSSKRKKTRHLKNITTEQQPINDGTNRETINQTKQNQKTINQTNQKQKTINQTNQNQNKNQKTINQINQNQNQNTINQTNQNQNQKTINQNKEKFIERNQKEKSISDYSKSIISNDTETIEPEDISLSTDKKSLSEINDEEIIEDNESTNSEDINEEFHWDLNIKKEELNELKDEISDNKSEKIFDFFNDIRLSPENYEIDANKNGFIDLIRKAIKSVKKPNYLIYNKIYFNEFKNQILKLSPQSLNDYGDIKSTILNEQLFNKFKVKQLYCVECSINNEKNAVLQLIQKNQKNALDDILTKKIDCCIICAIPIENSKNMKVYFVFLSN